MQQLTRFIDEMLFDYPALAGCRDKLALVLSGSRAVNYHVPSSDYDLLGVCDAGTYSVLLEQLGREPSIRGIDISIDQDDVKQRFGIEVDVVVYPIDPIQEAIQSYNDVVIWIWSNAQPILDRQDAVARLKNAFRGYPQETLEKKLKQHFLKDFHLSVHGLTYRPESQNVFAVVHALTSKIAEFCRMCCLLDGRPFPYEKWLLRACAETIVGGQLIPIFTRVLASLTELDNDLQKHWKMVRSAIDAIDTEACDILEQAMVSWGIDRDWLERAYYRRHDVLFQQPEWEQRRP